MSNATGGVPQPSDDVETSPADDASQAPDPAPNTEPAASAPSPSQSAPNNDASPAPAPSSPSAPDNNDDQQTSSPDPPANQQPTVKPTNKPSPTEKTTPTPAPEPTQSPDDDNDNRTTAKPVEEPEETQAPDETTEEELPGTTVVVSNSDGPKTSVIVIKTLTTDPGSDAAAPSETATNTSGSGRINPGSSGGGLDQKAKVAIGVVVPIAAIALFAIIGLLWWKRRRARRSAEEERRKEVEDYSYNPNADPTIPAVAGLGNDGGYEMREDGSSGYRGWGTTTLAGSTGRKASTTMSGGVNGTGYSDATSPRGNMSDTRSGEGLVDGSHSPEGEILGAMGPSAANNRGADVHRGPSNASSSYSAAGTDNSDGVGIAYGGSGGYYDQYSQNAPYDGANQRPDGNGAPVIRDNPARRNTRIESPSHFQGQSAGISQNF